MRALRKGQARVFALQGGIVGEARIVEHACGVGPCALTEAILWLQDHLASAETQGEPLSLRDHFYLVGRFATEPPEGSGLGCCLRAQDDTSFTVSM